MTSICAGREGAGPTLGSSDHGGALTRGPGLGAGDAPPPATAEGGFSAGVAGTRRELSPRRAFGVPCCQARGVGSCPYPDASSGLVMRPMRRSLWDRSDFRRDRRGSRSRPGGRHTRRGISIGIKGGLHPFSQLLLIVGDQGVQGDHVHRGQ